MRHIPGGGTPTIQLYRSRPTDPVIKTISIQLTTSEADALLNPTKEYVDPTVPSYQQTWLNHRLMLPDFPSIVYGIIDLSCPHYLEATKTVRISDMGGSMSGFPLTISDSVKEASYSGMIDLAGLYLRANAVDETDVRITIQIRGQTLGSPISLNPADGTLIGEVFLESTISYAIVRPHLEAIYPRYLDVDDPYGGGAKGIYLSVEFINHTAGYVFWEWYLAGPIKTAANYPWTDGSNVSRLSTQWETGDDGPRPYGHGGECKSVSGSASAPVVMNTVWYRDYAYTIAYRGEETCMTLQCWPFDIACDGILVRFYARDFRT